MTKEEAEEALDRAIQNYVAVVFADTEGLGLAKWLVSGHVDILSTNSSGYFQAVSDSLALHEQMGLLRYAQVQGDLSAQRYADIEEDEG